MTQSLDLLEEAAIPRTGTKAASSARSARSAPSPQRVASIDILRGLVMVLMALDHTRDFFGASGMNPRDVGDPALFLTRFVTHYCAPTFIFLAGISAFLYAARGRAAGREDIRKVSRFLFTRGLWLILMEFTLVHFAWSFSLWSGFYVTQVIFAIGASMVVLSGLVYLPRGSIAGIGLVLIAGHNLFDGIHAQELGGAGWIWTFLHEPKLMHLPGGATLFALYPLIPWIGVMAAGYALGPLFNADRATRVRRLVMLGTLTTLGFVVLRATDLYGDPASWTIQEASFATVLSFLNCEKYPPSLLYLMMTLGPALLLLAAFDNARGGRAAEVLIVFGRVPFFYYVAHVALIHALAVAYALASTGSASWLIGGPGERPDGYGMGLPGVYGVTLVVVVLLYPLCRRYGALKRRAEWWWSYL
jgi:uncharacterized membrane protein